VCRHFAAPTAGKKVVVLESRTRGAGQTGRTTAHIMTWLVRVGCPHACMPPGCPLAFKAACQKKTLNACSVLLAAALCLLRKFANRHLIY
jgi:hypothetical protein